MNEIDEELRRDGILDYDALPELAPDARAMVHRAIAEDDKEAMWRRISQRISAIAQEAANGE